MIGAYYYLRIVYLMYFGEETETIERSMSAINVAILLVSALAMTVGAINLFELTAVAETAAESLYR